MKPEQLTKEQIELRNQTMFEIWNNCKGKWTMRQIARMFNCSLPYFYQIIREEYKKVAGKK